MIKELMHDPIFLAGKSEVATKEDLQVAKDLPESTAKSTMTNTQTADFSRLCVRITAWIRENRFAI